MCIRDSSLQRMQDFGVNLICVEDGIDSSKDSGKLMISVPVSYTHLDVYKRQAVLCGSDIKIIYDKQSIRFQGTQETVMSLKA